MRGLIAPGVALVLVACSSPEPPAEPADASSSTAASAEPSSPSISAIQSGGGLRGEVSGLSGEVTDFRVRQTTTATIVEIASDVLFAFDSADLSPTASGQMSRAADLVRQGGPGRIEVRGYTDNKGDTAYNLELSERRATVVADWLSNNGGIAAGRLQARGLGEANPIAPNARPDSTDNPAGRALNRRVTIVIPKA